MIAVHAGRWVMAGLAAAGTGELAAKLSSFVMDNRLPGAVAGVVHGDDLVWSAGVGFADTGTRRPMQPGALFRIASVTKTFTGTAVMQLRDAGRLDLDDPAVAYLPELRGAVSPFAPVEAVTIRRMLSHESGLPAAPPGTDWSVPVYQGDAALTLARAGEIVLRVAPNAAHILRPRLSAARRDRDQGQRDAVLPVPARVGPRPARHVSHGLRTARGDAAGPPCGGLRLAGTF
jgi:CubicO group peptidase (beta-lactamase class C family)